MEEEEMKAILREAFGDSSSDSDGEPSDDRRRRVNASNSIWEPVAEISGLWICRDFLTAEQQSSLLSAIEEEGYLADASRNQAMRFGNLPPWANELSCIIRDNVLLDDFPSKCMDPTFSDSSKESRIFPPEILWREPLFDQFIVNIYQPGEGICAHVDLMRFEDGIAIISLESSCVMHFSSVEDEVKGSVVPTAKIPVLLTPGSLVLMWGEARYLWKHEINRKPGFQIWQGREIEQKRRVSVTFRRLCRTE